jgi:LacI family transcriptional regulator
VPATIRDVARYLNLSITTVSRALNNYDDVSDTTRQRVLQAAAQLGYVPNRAARQLRRKRSDTIGYILPAAAPRFLDPFFAEFIAGLGDEASKKGLDLIVSTAPPGSKFEKQAYQRWLQGKKVDGIVLNRMHLNDWRVQYLSQNHFPFVTLERSLDPIDYPAVEIQGRHWFKILIDHLVSLGHSRIAYIGANPDLKIQTDRFGGYQDGLQFHGIPLDPELVVEGDLTSDAGYRAGKLLLTLPNPPSAIACIDDMTAIGVLHIARDLGWMVGQNLAVVGFDGIEGFNHTQPPLTTINQPVYAIAQRLVQMLVDRIEGKAMDHQYLQIEPVLEIRQSTTGK